MSSMPEVLVVGDANLDLVLRGDVRPRFGQAEQLLDDAELTLGGSAALVAHGLARLGVGVGLIAAVGADDFARLTVEHLTAASVDVTGVVARPGGRTGLSVILSDADRAILTHLGVVDSLCAADLPGEWPGVRHVHFASPYLVGALRAELPEVMRGLRAQGITVSLDTNDDPQRAWSDLRGLLTNADVVLPNRDEVQRWADALDLPADDWEMAAAAIAALGPHVVTKTGADGGHWCSPEGQTLQVRPPSIAPVDTTGAGDSFDAGWIAASVTGLDPLAALGWAVTAGSLSTRMPGGSGGQPSRGELLAALTQPSGP